MAEHPKNQGEHSKPHDLVKPGSTIDPSKGQAGQPAPPPAQGQQQGQQGQPARQDDRRSDMERMRDEDPRFLEKTRPEDPSGRPGQLTRDNVNPHIPSAKRDPKVINPGGIVDPTSLGMEQGGKAPSYSDAHASLNEPPGSDVGGDGQGTCEGRENQTPTIETLDPDEIEIGAADTVLHVHGTGFTPESVIHFAGHDEPTSFVNDTEITTGLKPSLWQEAVVVQCSVKNGELVSEEEEFEFLEPEAPAASRQSKRTKPKKAKKRK